MNKKTSTPRRLRSNSPEIQFIEEIRKVPLAKSHEQCRAPPVKRSRREVPLVQTQKIIPPPPQKRNARNHEQHATATAIIHATPLNLSALIGNNASWNAGDSNFMANGSRISASGSQKVYNNSVPNTCSLLLPSVEQFRRMRAANMNNGCIVENQLHTAPVPSSRKTLKVISRAVYNPPASPISRPAPINNRLELQWPQKTLAIRSTQPKEFRAQSFYCRMAPYGFDSAEEDVFQGRFQCTWEECNATLNSNISFINHVMAHMLQWPTNEDEVEVNLDDLCRCCHCLRSFSSPYELQTHLNAVHSSSSRRLRATNKYPSTTCFICEKHFDNHAALVSHMNGVHVQADAPYQCRKCQFRSSLRIDIIQHFQKEHFGTRTLMCPLCLWTVNISAMYKNALRRRVQAAEFVHHMQRHETGPDYECDACALRFSRIGDKNRHRTLHGKTTGQSLIPIAFVDGADIPSNLYADCQLRSSRCLRRQFDRSNVSTSSVLCIECHIPMGSDDHFCINSIMSCIACSYATSCNNAFRQHMSTHSSHPLAIRYYRSEPLLAHPANCCTCKYTSVRGNRLAAHANDCSNAIIMLKTCVSATTSHADTIPSAYLRCIRLKSIVEMTNDVRQWCIYICVMLFQENNINNRCLSTTVASSSDDDNRVQTIIDFDSDQTDQLQRLTISKFGVSIVTSNTHNDVYNREAINFYSLSQVDNEIGFELDDEVQIHMCLDAIIDEITR